MRYNAYGLPVQHAVSRANGDYILAARDGDTLKMVVITSHKKQRHDANRHHKLRTSAVLTDQDVLTAYRKGIKVKGGHYMWEPNCQKQNIWRKLADAVETNNVDRIHHLLSSHKIDLNRRNGALLVNAVMSTTILPATVTALLDCGADANTETKYGEPVWKSIKWRMEHHRSGQLLVKKLRIVKGAAA